MKTYYFFSLPTYGHVFPLLQIVEELVNRKERVVFYCRDDFKSIIAQTGCEFRTLAYSFKGFNAARTTTRSIFNQIMESIWQTVPYALGRIAGKNPLYLFHTVISSARPAAGILKGVRECMPAILKDMQVDKPDCIVEDSMSPFGRYLKACTGVTTVVIWSSPIYDSMLWWPAGLLNTFLKWKDIAKWREYETHLSHLAQDYNAPLFSMDELFFRNKGDLIISLTPEDWQPLRTACGDNSRWAGFCLPNAQFPIGDFPLEKLKEGKSIFCTIGTVFNDSPTFYNKCIAALGHTEYTVVMSVGDKLDIRQFGKLPDNFIVRAFVPQARVLEKVDLFLTHGPTNAIAEILKYKTPAIFHPQAYDQFLTTHLAHTWIRHDVEAAFYTGGLITKGQ